MASSEHFDVAERFGGIVITRCTTCQTRSELISDLYKQLQTQGRMLAWLIGIALLEACVCIVLGAMVAR